METKTEISPLGAEASEIASVSRRSFLTGSTAAAAVASTLSPSTISAAETTASDVTPELAQLFAQWRVARAELRRLSTLDDEAEERYYRTSPPIPDAIVARLDHLGCPVHGFKHTHYARRCLEPRAATNKYVLNASYWRKRGDEERAAAADEFIAADIVARAAAGCHQTIEAWEAQHSVMIAIEVKIERFVPRSNGDIFVLATLAQSFEDDGREFPEDLAKSIVGHILRLNAASSHAASSAASQAADDEIATIRSVVEAARDAERAAMAAEGTLEGAAAEELAALRDAEFETLAERIWAQPPRSLEDVRKRAELAHRYDHQYFDERDVDFVEGLPIGERCDAELVKGALTVLRRPFSS